MQDEARHEPSATDDRIQENRIPAPVAPATRNVNKTEAGGLPPGQSDDQRSPLDGVFFDPKVKREQL